MRSILFGRILLLTVTSFPPIRGYILGPGCAAYSNDIHKALLNSYGSTVAARSTLNLQNDRVEDWFGLLESLFPGLNYSTPYTMQQWMLDPNYDIGPETISLTQTLQNIFTLVTHFSEDVYDNLQTILDDREDLVGWINPDDLNLPEDLQLLDRTTEFWCDISGFYKADPTNGASPFWAWFGPGGTREYLQITTEPELCPPGVNTRLAKHPATVNPPRPAYLIIILCPQVVTQTPDRPKMWATLSGQQLTNTRPTAGIQDEVLYLGMHIDALRQRVLSVWIGRMVILITGIKYSDRMHVSIHATTFEQCKTLGWSAGMDNLDSLSLYITGARIFFDTGITWYARTRHFSHAEYWNEDGIYVEQEDPWGFASDQGDESDPGR